jgi:hypothetical protein
VVVRLLSTTTGSVRRWGVAPEGSAKTLGQQLTQVNARADGSVIVERSSIWG